MHVLITGAAGFLGRGLIIPFEERKDRLRLMDVIPFESPHEVVVGDVSDLNTVMKIVEGVEAIVIAHMAPRSNNGYELPTQPFDVNVKGTANLFHAAVQHGVKAVVLISSLGVLYPYKTDMHSHLLPPKGTGNYYSMTKVCQEAVAESFATGYGIRVACVRPSYILDADACVDKYGRKIEERNIMDLDRRDIGEVSRLFLDRTDLAFECFNLAGTRESMIPWDVQYTCDRLNWKPKYDFSWLKEPAPKENT